MSKTYVLRTCLADMTSYGGFVWPEHGPVTAPDWSPIAECGHGLHGALMGEGDGSLLSWDTDAKWLVVEIDANTYVDLKGKVKFPSGTVVFCGSKTDALADIVARGADPAKIIGGTATAGYRGTATAGYGGTATAGYGGTATAGDRGTATAGDRGTIIVCWWDGQAKRYRTAVGDVGDGTYKAGVPYRVVDGKLAEVAP